jgi:hypothetical protein
MSGLGNVVYSEPPGSGGGGAGPLPGVTVPLITFAVGDGQLGTPIDGQASLAVATLQGQSIFNKELLVIREGIALLYDSAIAANEIRRFNSGGLGGWTFEVSSGLLFFLGERYQVYIIGVNNTIQV